jgi:hypothetical protein
MSKELIDALKQLENLECLAQDANDEENESKSSSELLGHEREAFLIRERLDRMHELIMTQEMHMQELNLKMDRLLDALAQETQQDDPDAPLTTYMDGSPVR